MDKEFYAAINVCENPVNESKFSFTCRRNPESQ